MAGNEWRIVGFTSTAHALNHLMEISYAPLLVFISREFGVEYGFLGAVVNAMALAYGLSAPLGGFLADRIGSKRMLWFQLLVAGVASLLVALSPNIWFMAVTLTLLGLAAGMYHPAGLSFITRGVRARTMATGYHGMAGSLAVAVAPAIAVALAGLWNWRAAFVAYGVAGLACALFVMLSRLGDAAPAREDGEEKPSAQADNPSAVHERRGASRLLWVPLIVVFLINSLVGFIYRGAVSYLPLHLTDNLNVDLFGVDPETLAGYFATVALTFGVAGQYVGGYLGERVRREKLAVVFGLLLVPFLFLMGVTGGVWLVVWASAFAFFNFMTQPIYVSLLAEYTPPERQGGALGIMFLVSGGVGSFAATMGGYIADRWSTSLIFLILGGLAVVIFLAATFLLVSSLRRARVLAKVPVAAE